MSSVPAPVAYAPCTWAACRETATTRRDEWAFCDHHARQHDAIEDDEDPDDDDTAVLDETAIRRRCAGDHTVSLNRAEAFAAFARLETEGRSSAEIADRLGTTQRTVTRWRNGHNDPISLPGVSMTTPTNGIGLLLEQASAHGNPKVKRLGERVEGLLDDLRMLMKESEAQEEARREVARLERLLAEAKAKARGAKVTAISSAPSATSKRTEPLPCRKGCGKICNGAAGRSMHERHCQAEAEAAS